MFGYESCPKEETVFSFLNDLRKSGTTNMYEASPYIVDQFGCTRYEANRLLVKWMENFKDA